MFRFSALRSLCPSSCRTCASSPYLPTGLTTCFPFTPCRHLDLSAPRCPSLFICLLLDSAFSDLPYVVYNVLPCIMPACLRLQMYSSLCVPTRNSPCDCLKSPLTLLPPLVLGILTFNASSEHCASPVRLHYEASLHLRVCISLALYFAFVRCPSQVLSRLDSFVASQPHFSSSWSLLKFSASHPTLYTYYFHLRSLRGC